MRGPRAAERTAYRQHKEATCAGNDQPVTMQTRQSDKPGGGAPASPPAFVAGWVAPTDRGGAATLQVMIAPALVGLAFAA